MAKLKIGIVGIGHLGSKHLKVYDTLQDKVSIMGICDIKAERTLKLAQHYKVPFFKNYHSLLDKVDAVNVCVPTNSHFAIAQEFLKKRVHTFIEKPITTTVSEAQKLIDLAKESKVKLQVGHIERFNSAFRAVKRLVQNPLFIECHRLNYFPNRSLDIGVVMDLMIHDIDIILGLVNSPIKEIQAVGVNILTPLEDIANCRLTFASGCVCNLTASRVSADVMRKIRIFLKNTYISLDYVQQEAFVYKKSLNLITKHALPIQKEESLKEELESFVNCIQQDKKPVVSGVEAKQALAVALQIIKKIWKTPKNI